MDSRVPDASVPFARDPVSFLVTFLQEWELYFESCLIVASICLVNSASVPFFAEASALLR